MKSIGFKGIPLQKEHQHAVLRTRYFVTAAVDDSKPP